MRILVIDDDRELCMATALVLQNAGYDVDLCHDGETGRCYLEQNAYALAIVDRMLPQLQGADLLAAARKRGNNTPVLMLTALGSVEDRVTGLDAGADDYLVKPFDMRELLARIRALSRRPEQLMSATVLRYGDVELNVSELTMTGDRGCCGISRREAELLEVLLRHPNQVLPRGMLLTKVWGPFADIDETSLDSYIHFARRRLRAVSGRLRISTLRGIGYRLEQHS